MQKKKERKKTTLHPIKQQKKTKKKVQSQVHARKPKLGLSFLANF